MRGRATLRAVVMSLLVLSLAACESGPFSSSPSSTPVPPNHTATESAETVPTEETGPLEQIPTEEVSLTGHIVLPEGAELSLADLSIATNQATLPARADGTFSAPALRGDGSATLAFALNKEGNPVLMRVTRGEATSQESEMSVASTARALVLFDPAILMLPPDLRTQAEALYDSKTPAIELEDAVVAALLTDPVDPLNGDGHPEVYERSGNMAAEILKELEAQEEQGSLPARAPGLLSPAASGFATSTDRDYVRMEDDEQQMTPEVSLYNGSFTYYKAKVRLDGKEFGSYLLDRNKPHTAIIHWPLGYYTRLPITPGDGDLTVEFEKDQYLTMFDLSYTLVINITGIPAANIKQLQEDAQYALGGAKEGARLVRNLVDLCSRAKGMTTSQVAVELAKMLAVSGTMIALTAKMIVERRVAKMGGQDYLNVVARFIGSKAAWWAYIGYGSYDMGTMVWSTANAPSKVTEEGKQLSGIYPAVEVAVSPSTISAAEGEPYQLSASVKNLPENVPDVTVVFTPDNPQGAEKEVEVPRQMGGGEAEAELTNQGTTAVEVTVKQAGTERVLAKTTVPLAGATPVPTATPLTEPSGWSLEARVLHNYFDPNTCTCPCTTRFADDSFSVAVTCPGSHGWTCTEDIRWGAVPTRINAGESFQLTLAGSSRLEKADGTSEPSYWGIELEVPLNWVVDKSVIARATDTDAFIELDSKSDGDKAVLLRPTNVQPDGEPYDDGLVNASIIVALSNGCNVPGTVIEWDYTYHAR